MEVIHGKDFHADNAWGAKDIAVIEGASVRLHWTDAPYKWHINDGDEVFVVLSGIVVMFYTDNGNRKSVTLNDGDIFYASQGEEHVAHPKGEARILVIEKSGSI